MRAVLLPSIMVAVQVVVEDGKVFKKAYDLAKTNKFYLAK